MFAIALVHLLQECSSINFGLELFCLLGQLLYSLEPVFLCLSFVIFLFRDDLLCFLYGLSLFYTLLVCFLASSSGFDLRQPIPLLSSELLVLVEVARANARSRAVDVLNFLHKDGLVDELIVGVQIVWFLLLCH